MNIDKAFFDWIVVQFQRKQKFEYSSHIYVLKTAKIDFKFLGILFDTCFTGCFRN
jgi:hypothetical protein